MQKFYQKDIINTLQTELGLSKTEASDQVANVILALKTLTDTPNSTLTIRGLGKFTRTERKAYTGRNPATGQPVQVPAKQVLRFK